MRRWAKRIAALLALILASLLVYFTMLKPKPVSVEVVTVEKGYVEETVTNSRAGTVRTRARAELSPEFGGRAVEIPFREGERVKRGQIVLRLDNELQSAEYELAEKEETASLSQREETCLAAERAARERERIRRLAEQEILSSDVLDQATTEANRSAAACEAASANVNRARAARELARKRLDKMVLRAPFDGVVAELSTEVGEYVTPSPPGLPIPPIIDILDPESIYVSAPMDEVDSARIAAGQPVRITVDSHPGRHFAGRVVRVAPYVLDVEAQNRTMEIEVEFEEADVTSLFLPGTSADVEVILDRREGTLRVPTSAVLEGNQILVVENDRLVSRPVRVGLRNWDYTEIVEGLSEGEKVVMSLDRPGVKAGAAAVLETSTGKK